MGIEGSFFFLGALATCWENLERRKVMIAGILISVGVIILVLVIIVALQPAEFRIARSIGIAAPGEVVFLQVNDFHHWDAWSPWAKVDPNMKKTYAGAEAGTGAVYSWVGNKKVGEGRMTLTQSRPNEWVGIRIEFLKPFVATNHIEFTFKPVGDQILVTWAMSGHKNFMFKAAHLLMNMNKMVSGDFDKGLLQMKAVAESAASKTIRT
jgi:hypothetical protein